MNSYGNAVARGCALLRKLERIKELEAENERLRSSLRSIAEEESTVSDTLGWKYAAIIAKVALENNDEH